MIVRTASQTDWPLWAAMLAQLHPEQSAAEFEKELEAWTALPEPYIGFLAFTPMSQVIGMMDARIRNYAEGSPDLRAAYIEDVWIEPAYRGAGVAQRLLFSVESWARDQGLQWLGSDVGLDNIRSHQWHLASGFEEVERIVVFGKRLA
jgi:aminoglycoside 6'-N-acetyltransferase I